MPRGQMISGRIYDNMRAVGLDDWYVNSDLGLSRTAFCPGHLSVQHSSIDNGSTWAANGLRDQYWPFHGGICCVSVCTGRD